MLCFGIGRTSSHLHSRANYTLEEGRKGGRGRKEDEERKMKKGKKMKEGRREGKRGIKEGTKTKGIKTEGRKEGKRYQEGREEGSHKGRGDIPVRVVPKANWRVGEERHLQR